MNWQQSLVSLTVSLIADCAYIHVHNVHIDPYGGCLRTNGQSCVGPLIKFIEVLHVKIVAFNVVLPKIQPVRVCVPAGCFFSHFRQPFEVARCEWRNHNRLCATNIHQYDELPNCENIDLSWKWVKWTSWSCFCSAPVALLVVCDVSLEYLKWDSGNLYLFN